LKKKKIIERLDAVEELKDKSNLSSNLRVLKEI
jgi:DNA mismatch repair ATPase MutS